MEEQKKNAFFLAHMAQEQAGKLARYTRLNRFDEKGQIVLAGSSLMEQFPINELTQGMSLPYHIYNRGVGGFVINQMLEALEPCVLALVPRYLFLNIGTNDMNGPDYRLEILLEKYETLLDRVRARLPKGRNLPARLLSSHPRSRDAAASQGDFPIPDQRGHPSGE